MLQRQTTPSSFGGFDQQGFYLPYAPLQVNLGLFMLRLKLTAATVWNIASNLAKEKSALGF